MGDYYQPDPHVHHRKESKAKELNIHLPHFHGKHDVDVFLDWEMKVN